MTRVRILVDGYYLLHGGAARRSRHCRSALHFAWILLTILSTTSSGAPARGAMTPAYDYLFVVDTSFSMVRKKQILAESLTELIASGLGGRMHAGDRLGFWTFNEKVHSERLPSQTWTPETSQALADQAGRSLRSHWFEKQTRLDAAMAEIQKAAKAAKFLTVILLSDGDSPMTGTPFDRSVNLVYREHFRELQRVRKPFITTLVASEGQFVAWAVAVGGGGVKVPEAPNSLGTARSEATNASPSAIVPSPNQVRETVVKDAPRSSPPVEEPKGPTRLEETRASLEASPGRVENRPVESVEKSQTQTISDGPKSKALNSTEGSATPAALLARNDSPEPARGSKPVAEDETPPRAQTTNPAAPFSSTSAPAMTLFAPPPSRPEKTAPDSIPRSQSRAPTIKTVERAPARDTRAQEPATTAAATAAPDLPAQQVAAAAPKDPASRGLTSLLTGLTLLGIALGLLSWSIRSYRPRGQSSIISRSLDGKAPRRRF